MFGGGLSGDPLWDKVKKTKTKRNDVSIIKMVNIECNKFYQDRTKKQLRFSTVYRPLP